MPKDDNSAAQAVDTDASNAAASPDVSAAPSVAVDVSTVPVVPAEFPVTVTEFCSRISMTDRRVELISAFFRTETAAGRVHDTESAFAVRLADFATQPA